MDRTKDIWADHLDQVNGTPTLRDQFAMAALTGLTANPNLSCCGQGFTTVTEQVRGEKTPGGLLNVQTVATTEKPVFDATLVATAYCYADLMLKERQETKRETRNATKRETH